MAQITFFGNSDIGLKRTQNEDDFAVSPEHQYCLVVDGMGGAAAGALASRIFKDTALEVFSAFSKRSEMETLDLIKRVFLLANGRILAQLNKKSCEKRMGCTAELLAISDRGGFVLGHVGDSRTYRLRHGQLKQLTRDHTFVQKKTGQALISQDTGGGEPLHGVILRAVGVETELALDTLRGTLLPGDLFLLCTDGLTDMVSDSLINHALSSEVDLPHRIDILINLAKINGGKDNITALVCQIG